MARSIDILLNYLAGEGVRHIFGLPGRAIDPLLDSLYDRTDLRFIQVRDEEGGSLMANGYARVAGTLGVCCGTTGGGTTKLVTGVASAYMDSVPILAVTGQIETKNFGRGAFQESTAEGRSLDSVGLFRGITKYSTMVFSAESMGRTVRKAIRTSLCGRPGPVHLNIPRDVQDRPARRTKVYANRLWRPGNDSFDRNGVKTAVRLLKRARTAAIVAGTGLLSSRAAEALVEFAEATGIPVVTTLKGKGVMDERSAYCFGPHGIVGSPAASTLLRSKLDVVLALGTTLNEFATNGWDDAISPRMGMIQVDIDPDELGKNHPIEVGIVGDGARVLTELTWEARRQHLEPRYSSEQLETMKSCWGTQVSPEKMRSLANNIFPQRAMRELRQALPDDSIVLADSGNNAAWAIHYYPNHRPGGFMSGMGMGSMGYAVAAVVGAQLAAGDVPCVAVCGDGAFLMHVNELATAVQYQIPAIWVVLNDARLGMVYFAQKNKLNNRVIGSCYDYVPLARLAEDFGALGLVAKAPGQVEAAVRQALAARRPAVIEVLIDREEVPPMAGRIGKPS